MTILSTFYDTNAGTPASLVTEVKWAKAHPQIGSATYGVDGANDFKVTAHPSTPSAVNVAPGKAWGQGVFDESDTTETVVCDVPAAGTSRWDLICIRRNWGPLAGGPTTVTNVEGGTVKAIPAGRFNNPGSMDDQPLALVQWTAGQTQPTQIVDLRCWARNGGVIAKDELALTYLANLGASVKIGTERWSYGLLANDIPGWVNEAGSGPWVALTPLPGWVSNGILRARTVGGGAFLHVQADVRYANGPAMYEGWIFAQFPAGMRPVEGTFIPGTTNGYRSGTFYVVSGAGISLGPFPVGTICQCNGLAPLK